MLNVAYLSIILLMKEEVNPFNMKIYGLRHNVTLQFIVRTF